MNHYSLPLFPLNVVVCPGGLLPLRIFEARYLDMVKNCLRNQSPFAVVTVLPEGETDPEGNFPFANIGTSLEISDADVSTVGLMMIRCEGNHRIKVNSFSQQADGLVIGEVTDIANDVELPIPDDLKFASSSLQRLIESLPSQGILISLLLNPINLMILHG
jgi:Lon protease-like protein